MRKFNVVIGAGYGDEGKGATVDGIIKAAHDSDKSSRKLVVRFNGGQQAGHTVIADGVRHVFSNFGSGTLRDVPTYWSRHCTVDPIAVMNEYAALKSKGVDPLLVIDPECPVTTPYDAYASTKGVYIENGTCGVGVGSTVQRECDLYSLKVMDLLYPSVKEIKLRMIRNYYSHDVGLDIDRFMCAVSDMLDAVQVATIDPVSFDFVVFEGAQGLMLDQNFGFFPHVTRSNTGIRNVVDILGVNRKYPVNVRYVTRGYVTRHGNGPIPRPSAACPAEVGPGETNVTNKYQGEFRTGVLDAGVLSYAIERNRADYGMLRVSESMDVTCMDHMKSYRYVGVNGGAVVASDASSFVKRLTSDMRIRDYGIRQSPKN